MSTHQQTAGIKDQKNKKQKPLRESSLAAFALLPPITGGHHFCRDRALILIVTQAVLELLFGFCQKLGVFHYLQGGAGEDFSCLEHAFVRDRGCADGDDLPGVRWGAQYPACADELGGRGKPADVADIGRAADRAV